MNWFYFISACLAFVLGIVHSVLGNILIFRRLGVKNVISAEGDRILRKEHIRTLWASWHLLTLFGWALSAILFTMAWVSAPELLGFYIRWVLITAFLVSAVFWVYGTRGRHPAWVILLLIAIILWLA